MRILYVTKESPLFPAGGIGTYIGYMAQAMADAGHEVYLFTWSDRSQRLLTTSYRPFKPQHVHIEWIEASNVWRQTPVESFNHALATYLRPRIRRCVQDWNIDVIEATDFLAPALTYFQDVQTRRPDRTRLCVTYNHGFIEDFHEADQIDISRQGLNDLLAERQQCRVSDLVVAPSRIACERLRSYGITDKVAVVREPYVFQSKAKCRKFRNEITYIGRISISKGIDKIIYYANAVHDVLPLQHIRLIGRVVDTPFRVKDIKTYVMARLHPALRDVTQFYGFVPRQNALALLEPGALCPSLGSAETFSYACVESIDCGLLPVVRHGTPMAEFIPSSLQEIVLDEHMRQVEELQVKTERIVACAPAILREVRSYCAEQLRPDRIARQMGELYERKLKEKSGVTSVSVKRRASIKDVTVLIPAYRPTAEFAETVDSLLLQSAGIPKVLICNDGTPEEHGEWFAYAASLLPDCTILRQPNTGLLGARNTLIQHCATKLAVFLDTDDVLAGNCLARMLEAYNRPPMKPQAVLPQRVNFGESGELIVRTLLDDHVHLLENDFRMTGLIETGVLREIGFDATCRNGEADDWIFWLEFTARGYTGVLLPELLFHYRFRQGSMSWPWSMGQHVGSQLKLRQVITEACRRNPDYAVKIARALYTHTVRQVEQS